ncbi:MULTISPECIES: hypothetical protein [unclassified Curtobacterium]|uniref:hypothetical protein n=1 Tax=unclassified Curtobacterium TaxID=257496 RepID=UPI0015E8BD59|nr:MULTISPECIES: hypothetical protein [unclassified Curtobacterium]
MSDATNGTGPDGVTDQEAQRTEDLPDGSASGNATQDPQQDSDVDSGGEPAEPEEG